jgi:excinuclease ABC subunit A
MRTIQVRGAAEHNLRDVDLDIGRGITVLVGVSGSGKSSLAFDTIYAEARRRFLDAISLRSPFQRVRPPHVRSIRGLGPAVAVSQNELNRNPLSTVASAAGLLPFLRVLYSRFGESSCPSCGRAVRPLTTEARRAALEQAPKPVDVLAILARGAQGGHETLRKQTDVRIEDATIALRVARLDKHADARQVQDAIRKADELGAVEILAGDASLLRAPVCPQCGTWVGTFDPPAFRPGQIAASTWRLNGITLEELVRRDVAQAATFARELNAPGAERATSELVRRLEALNDLGLGYLGLDRPMPTLSRGESQRVRIAQILVNRLEDLLHVLDEPSIGLHPREVRALLDTLAKLPGPVVMVEHDPRAAALADEAIEIGPGAGEHGGTKVFQGTPAELWGANTTSGERFSRRSTRDARPPDAPADHLSVRQATLRNLKGFDCRLPIGRLTVVVGPSGAGKTTLARDVVLASVEEGEPVGCGHIHGPQLRAIAVDQSPIGNNPRSNPATYTKLLDHIRTRFARATGESASAFSFNRPEGACQQCEGYGALEVRLPRLPSTWIECESCEGARFKPDVLEHRVNGHSIADVLALTVEDAYPVLAEDKRAARVLDAMLEVGLGYLALGQPSPTLSGGEAQRIRLAKHLARVKGGDLLVLDEPTIGLHPADIDRMLDTIERLTHGGATVLVVEHSEDVIAAADWVIELGPVGGPEGGRLVYEGPPRPLRLPPPKPRTKARTRARVRESIRIRGAVANNLKSVDVDVPKGKLTVVTGLSGSGKSSLVRDVLEAEASRRLLECLSMYERQGTREGPEAPVGSIDGLGATAVLEGGRTGSRATVGLITGLSAQIGVLLSRLGAGVCKSCGGATRRATPLPESTWRCEECEADAPRAEPRHFSPDVYAAACIRCGGMGYRQVPSEAKLVRDPSKTIKGGALVSPGYFPKSYLVNPGTGGNQALNAIAARHGFDPVETAWQDIPEAGRNALLWGDRKEGGRWPGILPILSTEHGDLYTDRFTCDACHGSRLREPFNAITLAGLTRHDLHRMKLGNLQPWFAAIEAAEDERDLLEPVLRSAADRLRLLQHVGLDYVHLDRLVWSLSAGEAQRVRLASVIGSDLRDLTVIMDEPTRGLHPSEVDALGDALRELARMQNTVVVVEHDERVICIADHVIEIGPGSGASGGRVVTKGAPATLKGGVTSRLLRGEAGLRFDGERRTPQDWLVVHRPRGNNLRAEEVRLPLGVLAGVCGPSGSGKSTLLVDTVARALAPQRQTATWSSGPTRPEPHERIEAPPLRLVMVDQARRGVQSPGLFLGTIAALRKRYAEHDEAAAEPCDECGGGGVTNTDMGFLASIRAPCEACDGTGYTHLARDLELRGWSLPALESLGLGDVRDIWPDADEIARPLHAAVRLGLGYLALRQPVASLSGGECQRLRLADALARKRQSQRRLFVLDEPTVGLHALDVSALLSALNELVDAGDGVIVIEHHPSLLACCDWLVELDEGDVVANGPPEDLARASTRTAPYIEECLR